MLNDTHRVIVSETWNYEGPNGPNLIRGKIARKLSNKCLIFQASTQLHFGNLVGEFLILSPRYVKEVFGDDQPSVSVNGRLLLSELDLELEEIAEEHNAKFVITGVLEKL